MVTELVSVRISFHPDGGGEQVTVAREFVVAGRSRDEVMGLFRAFCDQVAEEYVMEAGPGQMGIDFEKALGESGEKESDDEQR